MIKTDRSALEVFNHNLLKESFILIKQPLVTFVYLDPMNSDFIFKYSMYIKELH